MRPKSKWKKKGWEIEGNPKFVPEVFDDPWFEESSSGAIDYDTLVGLQKLEFVDELILDQLSVYGEESDQHQLDGEERETSKHELKLNKFLAASRKDL